MDACYPGDTLHIYMHPDLNVIDRDHRVMLFQSQTKENNDHVLLSHFQVGVSYSLGRRLLLHFIAFGQKYFSKIEMADAGQFTEIKEGHPPTCFEHMAWPY